MHRKALSKIIRQVVMLKNMPELFNKERFTSSPCQSTVIYNGRIATIWFMAIIKKCRSFLLAGHP